MKNIKLLIVFMLGMLSMYGISNAYKLNASLVTYDKKNTTLESEQVQGAIDELYTLISENSKTTQELLWTNPNPSSPLASQKIPLDLSSYKYIMIVAKMQCLNGYDYLPRTKTIVDNVVNTSFTLAWSNNGTIAYRRGATIEVDGVSFTSAIDGTGSVNNNVVLPIEIYGIK